MGYPLELPNALGGGATPDKAVENIIDAATSAIAWMLEQGLTPPAPNATHKRDEQINIRVSKEEKHRLAHAAQREGFRGISDYVRTTSLNKSA